MKELYTYKVNKETVKETKTDNGDGSFTLTEVKELAPTEVFLKRWSRREQEEMQTVYQKEFHRCISEGINTEKMLDRALMDANSGYISKADQERLFTLTKIKADKSLEYYNKKLSGENVDQIYKDILDIEKEVYEIKSTFKSIYDQSAEAIASRKLLIWAVLHMTFLKDGEKFNYVFPGPTFISKWEAYCNMDDNKEDYDFELKCFDKSYIFLQKFLSGEAETKEDFEDIERQIDSFFEKDENS